MGIGRRANRSPGIWRACSPRLPATVETMYARADSGFYCWEAVEAYEKHGVQFIISARKTSRLVEELKAAEWKRSPRTDADGQCEFRYQPEGWGKAYRFIALRYEKKPKPKEAERTGAIPVVRHAGVQLSRVRHQHEGRDRPAGGVLQPAGGAENLIKEANNDAGLAAHPSARWTMNCNHFQLAMLAYNLNCWLMLFNREEQAKIEDSAPHHAGDGPVAVSVSGGQDLAPRRRSPGALQRSLRRARDDGAVNGSTACDRAEWESVRAGAGVGASALKIRRA